MKDISMYVRMVGLKVCCGLMMFVLVGMTWAETGTVRLTIPDVSVEPGDEVVVPIELDSREAGPVRAIQAFVRYDPTVIEIVEIRQTERAKALSQFAYTIPAPGDLRLVIFDFSTNVMEAGTGPVAELVIRISSDAEMGTETWLAFVVDGPGQVTVLGQGDPYPLEIRDGKVKVGGEIAWVEMWPERTEGEFGLGRNWPNPSNSETAIAYSLDERGPVQIEICDSIGRVVRILVDAIGEAGMHVARWDGRDDEGWRVASGVYLCRMRFGGRSAIGKMTLVR